MTCWDLLVMFGAMMFMLLLLSSLFKPNPLAPKCRVCGSPDVHIRVVESGGGEVDLWQCDRCGVLFPNPDSE